MKKEGMFSPSFSAAKAPRTGAAGIGATPRHKTGHSLDPLIRAALNAASSGMIVLDNDLRVRLMTHRAASCLGLEADTGDDGKPFMRVAATSHILDDACLHTLAAVFSGADLADQRDVLLPVPTSDGGYQVLNVALRRAAAHGWLLTLDDVSQSRGGGDFLLDRESADPVTGLSNKPNFVRLLRERLDGAPGGATVLLRLNLRRQGATRTDPGARANESLLQLAARRIQACLRDDDVAARFIADEFAILVSHQTGRDGDKEGGRDLVAQLSDRLMETLSQPFMMEGQSIRVGVHIGVACAPEDGDVAEVLLVNAELALAASRAEHHGGWRFFEPRLDEQERQRSRLERALRGALGRQEFVLHYQPQIDVRSGRVRVFEALIRWQSPERGLVAPSAFIPLAEEIGLISDIGIWVLNTACREAAGWPDDIAIAVNASPLQIETGPFADAVAQALAASGLPAHRLEIEITENLLLAAKPAVTSTLMRLRDMGVHLVMDDFGTGYASLSQLARFRFNKIKIDRSLISAPDAVAEHSAIVRAIAALGVSLCVPTTAEGVETMAQLDRITEGGCTLVQGFYFSKPVPAEAVPALLERLDAEAHLQEA